MAKSTEPSKKNPEQVYEEITEKAKALYAATPETKRHEELGRALRALADEYRELTGKRVIY